MRKNNNMYEMYEEYKDTCKQSKKVLRKRQKLNADMRDKYGSPFKREDYNANKRDISIWNSMIGELEDDIKSIEMYLDFDDREFLHREYNNVKSMILNKNSYEGKIPFENLHNESIKDTTDIVTDVELQEEIVELLDDVLTERQKQVIYLYFWEDMTQEKIAKELGITQRGAGKILENSLNILKKCIKTDDFIDF